MARLGDFVGVSSVMCGSTNKSGILSASPRVLWGNFWWNLQLHLPPQVDFTPSFLVGDTPRCSSRLVVSIPILYREEILPWWNSGDNIMMTILGCPSWLSVSSQVPLPRWCLPSFFSCNPLFTLFCSPTSFSLLSCNIQTGFWPLF
jgi:hypothetical protein